MKNRTENRRKKKEEKRRTGPNLDNLDYLVASYVSHRSYSELILKPNPPLTGGNNIYIYGLNMNVVWKSSHEVMHTKGKKRRKSKGIGRNLQACQRGQVTAQTTVSTALAPKKR